jgi:hypothetical protein
MRLIVVILVASCAARMTLPPPRSPKRPELDLHLTSITSRASSERLLALLALSALRGGATHLDESHSAPARLGVEDLNQHVVNAEYAVRGRLLERAVQLEASLAAGEKLPFDRIVRCNSACRPERPSHGGGISHASTCPRLPRPANHPPLICARRPPQLATPKRSDRSRSHSHARLSRS